MSRVQVPSLTQMVRWSRQGPPFFLGPGPRTAEGPRRISGAGLTRSSGYLLPPLTHCCHGICQSPRASVGSRRAPPLFLMMMTSPRLEMDWSQAAFSVDMLRQPWLTLREPWSPTDHGAEREQMPLFEMRVATAIRVR